MSTPFVSRHQILDVSLALQCRAELIAHHRLLAAAVDVDARQTTRALTSAVADVCRGWSGEPQFEVPIDLYRTTFKKKGGYRDYQGKVDVVARFRDQSCLAIEIDREFKSWSKAKLVRAKELGFIELWIRWNGPRTYASGVSVVDVHHPGRCYLPRRP